jgi:hypothetical protein
LHLVNFKLFGTFAWYGLKLGSPTPEIAEAKEQFAEFISAKAALERNEHEKRKALRDKKQEVCENG